MNQIRQLVWLGVKQATVISLPTDQDGHFGRVESSPDPARVWTLDDLIESPVPSVQMPSPRTPILLRLTQADGGTVGMVAHQGTLYLSDWKPDQSPNCLDAEHARQLGWAGNTARLLMSWQESKR